MDKILKEVSAEAIYSSLSRNELNKTLQWVSILNIKAVARATFAPRFADKPHLPSVES